MPRFIELHPPGTRVSVVSKPGHPRLFVIAPGGEVPQRDLTGIWTVWLWRTLVLLGVYAVTTTAILWKTHKD